MYVSIFFSIALATLSRASKVKGGPDIPGEQVKVSEAVLPLSVATKRVMFEMTRPLHALQR